MSLMGETFYSLHSRRSQEHPQDLTPYSAVSSFNLPQSCDSTLITPVSLTQSLALNTTIAGCDLDIKLSPSDISPTYDMFNLDDEFSESKYNPPMKYKHPSGVLHISTSDSSFPPSPLVPSTPYWGSYGVSATPVSSRSDSSPSMNPSPIRPPLNTSGGLNNNSDRQTQATVSEQFQNRRPSIHSVPLLIAPRVPSPSSRQATTSHLNTTFRQNSLQPMALSSGPVASSHSRYSQSRPTMPIRRRRKSPKHSHSGDIPINIGEMTDEEQVLWRLTEIDRVPWKEVAARFTAETGKAMRVPALQMRKKRLVERLRVWTPSDDRALSLAFQDQHKLKWDQIADKMMLHGCVEKWPKEKVQKRWQELHPAHDKFSGEKYEEDSKSGILMGEDFGMDDWSDGINSLHGSENGGMSAVSPITIDEARSRQPSEASSHHLQIQQQMLFEQQQNWGGGSS